MSNLLNRYAIFIVKRFRFRRQNTAWKHFRMSCAIFSAQQHSSLRQFLYSHSASFPYIIAVSSIVFVLPLFPARAVKKGPSATNRLNSPQLEGTFASPSRPLSRAFSALHLGERRKSEEGCGFEDGGYGEFLQDLLHFFQQIYWWALGPPGPATATKAFHFLHQEINESLNSQGKFLFFCCGRKKWILPWNKRLGVCVSAQRNCSRF